MTRVVLREADLVVVDDVLPPADFRSVSQEVADGDYRWVHAQRWDKSWRLWDGHPLRGEGVHYDPMGSFGGRGARYPTSTAVDVLVDVIRRMADANPEVAGTEGVDWAALYLCPWLYPPGSALAPHRDAVSYAGSFTFFVHMRWNTHWGGELVVARPHADGSATRSASARPAELPWLSEEPEEVADDPGLATCISPNPNRLVLLGEKRLHRIARVDQNAGTHVRASIAGFFLRAPR